MNTLRGLSILAGLCLTGAAFAQSQTAPAQPSSSATPQSQTTPGQSNPSNTQPDQANPATYPTSPSRSTDPQSASSPHQRSAMRMAAGGSIESGMSVESREGKQVGTVSNVVNDSAGKPKYVVISESSGSNTAMPYMTAKHMLHSNKIVVDEKRLQDAPKVPESQLQDTSKTEWQSKADSYWEKHGKKHY